MSFPSARSKNARRARREIRLGRLRSRVLVCRKRRPCLWLKSSQAALVFPSTSCEQEYAGSKRESRSRHAGHGVRTLSNELRSVVRSFAFPAIRFVTVPTCATRGLPQAKLRARSISGRSAVCLKAIPCSQKEAKLVNFLRHVGCAAITSFDF